MPTTLFPRIGGSALINSSTGNGLRSFARPKVISSIPATFTVDLINLRTGESLMKGGATHTRSEFTDTYDNSPTTAEHLITVESKAYLQDKITPLALEKDPVVGVRIGVESEKGTDWQPMETHWITYLDSEPSERSGTFQVCLHTADGLWAMGRFPKTRSRVGRISEIVQSIADEWGIEAIICKTSASVRLIQSFQSDLEFIAERLIPRAISDDGRADFRLRIKANVLIFGPIDFVEAQMAIWDVDTVSGSGAVTDIVEEDASNSLIPRGAGGVRAVVASPYNPASELSSDPNSLLRLASFSQAADDATRYINVPVTEGEDTTEASAKAQNLFAKQRAEMYRVRFQLTNVLGVEVGDYIRFFSPDKPFDSTSKAGELSSYYLRDSQTIYENGNCTQKCVAARGQLAYSPPQTELGTGAATGAAVAGSQVNAASGVTPQLPQQGIEVLDPSGRPTSSSELPLPEGQPGDGPSLF